MKKIVFIVGESGSGKTHLQEKLLDNFPNTYCRIKSTTTRPSREGEVDGVQYDFVSHVCFERMIKRDELLQHVFFGGNYYGTQRKEYSQDQDIGLFVCTPEGIFDTVAALYDRGLEMDYEVIFFMTTDKKLREHGVDEKRIKRGNIRHQFMQCLFRNSLDDTSVTFIQDASVNEHTFIDVDFSLRKSR